MISLRSIWPHAVLAMACGLCLLPIVAIAVTALSGDGETIWQAAPELFRGQCWSSTLVAFWGSLGALILGLGAALAVTDAQFPGRPILSVALSLPLAIPGWLLGAIWIGAARQGLVPAPQGIGAAVLVHALTLYPWVYLPTRAALSGQSAQYRDLARSLGLGPWRRFFQVRLPLIAPALGMGALFVLVQILGDLGTAELFGIPSLSGGIHDAAFSLWRRDWAAQTSLVTLLPPLLAVALFAWLWRRAAWHNPSNRFAAAAPRRLSPLPGTLLTVGLTALLLPALLLPLALLLWWAWLSLGSWPLSGLASMTWGSLGLALAALLLVLPTALLLTTLLARRPALARWRVLLPIAALPFALPGAILALGLLAAASAAPEGLARSLLSNSPGLLLIGLCALAFPLALFSLRLGFIQLGPELGDLCRCCRITGLRRTWRVDMPLLGRQIGAASLLILITLLKELPVTMIVQPFGHQALSLRIYSFAGMDLLEESAIYALVIVFLVAIAAWRLDRLCAEAPHAAD